MERFPSGRSINGKVSPVEREYRVDLLAMRQIDQTRIGQLGMSIFALLHHALDAASFVRAQGEQFHKCRADATQQLPHGFGTASKHPTGFGDDRPAC